MIALLNKPRLKTKLSKAGTLQEQQHITSLVIVPHKDLAYQYLHWIERIVTSAAADSSPPQLSSVVQILVRDRGAHLTTGLDSLHEISPHILIGTPQALIDVWSKDQQALQLSRLSTVVVDEVDYLVETLPRKDANKSFRPAVMRATKRLLAHPGVTRELLDTLYAKRKELYERQKDEPGLAQYERRTGQNSVTSPSLPLPQLVMCSATLRGHLRTYLFQESGWLNKDNLLVYKGAVMTGFNVSSQGGHDVAKSKKINVMGGSGVSHSVLIVSNEEITNIEGAVASRPGEPDISDDNCVTPEVVFGAGIDPEEPKLDQKLVESKSDSQYIYLSLTHQCLEYAKTPSPFNPNALEAIATAFALDVPSVALLVLPASASVQRAVNELQEMGVNAHSLDLLKDEKGKKHLLHSASVVQENPTLLVSTLATTRGIDLPELSHVFILGVPDGPKVTARAVDAYFHVAGRVGRFGRGGRVITVVEKMSGTVEEAEDGEDGAKDKSGVSEASKMLRILKTIEVTAVRFEHFD